VKHLPIRDSEPRKAFVAPGDEIFTLKDSTPLFGGGWELGEVAQKDAKKKSRMTSGTTPPKTNMAMENRPI